MHSGKFRSAKNYIGKKVVIVGACTSGTIVLEWPFFITLTYLSSGHDIAYDCGAHGLDVTMVQRSSTYIMSIKEGMLRHMQGISSFTSL